ncbi:uncharacterized protein LOC123671613 [Harmonia axyridis]|uniref:uncharacterized protein LOC123671613 n=1 Tax=Harmonia axyridis TaxID=115357 RepID=UPI001E2763DE|nr:uncharacterized protein LOC123671613 [Harmonia axyridis]
MKGEGQKKLNVEDQNLLILPRNNRLLPPKKKYIKKHPEVLKAAKGEDNLNNSNVQKKADKIYRRTNPEFQKNASQRHSAKNLKKNEEYQKRFIGNISDEFKMRHVPSKIRRLLKDNGPISYWSESLLHLIEPYKLKKLSLSDKDIYKCPYCKARLYEEERNRKEWCCNNGAYNVQNLAPLTASFYNDREFLHRSRAYNNMFAFCATEVSGGYRHPSGLSFFKIEGRMYHQVYNLNARGQKFTTTGNLAQFVNRTRLFIDDGEERRHLAEGRSLKRNVIDQIHEFLNATNPLIPHFKILGQEQSIHRRLNAELLHVHFSRKWVYSLK